MNVKYDIALHQSADARHDTHTAGLITPNSSGRKIIGIEKVVQRFLIEVFTEKGSIPFQSNRGCRFLSALRSGYLLHETDVLHSYNLEANTIAENLFLDESKADPPEERFLRADLFKIAIMHDKILLAFIVRSWTKSATLVYPVYLDHNYGIYKAIEGPQTNSG